LRLKNRKLLFLLVSSMAGRFLTKLSRKRYLSIRMKLIKHSSTKFSTAFVDKLRKPLKGLRLARKT